jgi:hypothetical protein
MTSEFETALLNKQRINIKLGCYFGPGIVTNSFQGVQRNRNLLSCHLITEINLVSETSCLKTPRRWAMFRILIKFMIAHNRKQHLYLAYELICFYFVFYFTCTTFFTSLYGFLFSFFHSLFSISQSHCFQECSDFVTVLLLNGCYCGLYWKWWRVLLFFYL